MSLMQTSVAASLARVTGGQPTTPGGTFGEMLMSKLSPDYYSLVKAGKVFVLAFSFAAAATSAFVGGAAGTPIFGFYNGSAAGAGNGGVDFVPLYISMAIRTTGTAAALTDCNWWQASQGVAVTGAQTVQRQLYSLQQGGGQVYCMANVANTASVASNLTRASFSFDSVPAAATEREALFEQELKGSVVGGPGTYTAFGTSVALTAASLDFTCVFAELPA